jgi:hypothetical protein
MAKHHNLNLEKLGGLLGDANYKALPSLRATRIERASDGTIKLFHHGTAVVKWYPDGGIELNSGGYTTTTTKARINDALTGTPYHVFQRKGNWFIFNADNGYERGFYDGVKLGEEN